MENISKHDRIQRQIVSTCHDLGIRAKQEHKGHGWRADVYIPDTERPIAFEIQLSPQTLLRTFERQAKFTKDGIFGCWFFETPIPKLNKELEDLPVFYVEDNEEMGLLVNLGDRRKIDLRTFLENFISKRIQFRTIAKTTFLQTVKLAFYEMKCWKCGELNHLFFVTGPFYSSCNAKIKPEEALWESNSMEYRPEIVGLAAKFVESRKDLNLKLGQIKNRYSNTVRKAYMSFGCYNCDSIFGDYFVMEAKIDVMYEPNVITHQEEIELKETFELDIRHWCLPNNGQFCGDHL